MEVKRSEPLNSKDSRVDLNAHDAGRLFQCAKDASGWSWKDMGTRFGVHPNVVRQKWSKAKTTIPYTVYQQLVKLVPDLHLGSLVIKESDWYQKQQKERIWHTQRIHEMAEFAELYGIMLGDGCIYSTGKTICISGNASLDDLYLREYVARLFQFLFGCVVSFYSSENNLRMVIREIEVCQTFLDAGFPLGTKKQGLTVIPASFFTHKKLLESCLRGLFDTDGGVFHHPHSEVMMSFTSKIPSLLHSAQCACNQLGLKFGSTATDLQAYGDTAVRLFSRIGSSNPRNYVRMLHYIRGGQVPSPEKLAKLLKEDEYPSCTIFGPMV